MNQSVSENDWVLVNQSVSEQPSEWLGLNDVSKHNTFTHTTYIYSWNFNHFDIEWYLFYLPNIYLLDCDSLPVTMFQFVLCYISPFRIFACFTEQWAYGHDVFLQWMWNPVLLWVQLQFGRFSVPQTFLQTLERTRRSDLRMVNKGRAEQARSTEGRKEETRRR